MNLKISGIKCSFSPRVSRFQGGTPRDIQHIIKLAALAHQVVEQYRAHHKLGEGTLGQNVTARCGLASRSMVSFHYLSPEYKIQNAQGAFVYSGKLEDYYLERDPGHKYRDNGHCVAVFDFGDAYVIADPTIAQFAHSALEANVGSYKNSLPIKPSELAFSDQLLNTHLLLAFTKPTEAALNRELNLLFGKSTWKRSPNVNYRTFFEKTEDFPSPFQSRHSYEAFRNFVTTVMEQDSLAA